MENRNREIGLKLAIGIGIGGYVIYRVMWY